MKRKMTMMQERKMKVIKDIIKGKITKRMGSEQLFISVRQINRLIQSFKQEGSSAFIHKNTGRISPREISSAIRDDILKLRTELYADYNIQHFLEKLNERHNIKVSYAFLRTFLLNNLNLLLVHKSLKYMANPKRY
jgi:hypothetical protein